MATPIIMPKIEMAQEKATIIAWLKAEGDAVKKGDPLLEVETDKVTMEVEAPASGVLGGRRGQPGDEIRVTETIAYVLEPGEDVPETVEEEPAAAESGSAVDATPVAKRLADAKGLRLEDVRGTGRRGQVTKSDVEAALEREPMTESSPATVRATPASRRIAGELEVDLRAVSGSGPRGRVQADDVRSFAQARDEEAHVVTKVVPLVGMRRTIAERMTRSYQTAPHIVLGVDVNMGRFEETRRRLNTRLQPADGSKVSVTALLVKAVAWALARHPWLNSTLRDDGIHLLPEINVGVAVALEQGLIVPVVRAADTKSISRIATEVRELADRARADCLRPADVLSGTFTISNLGPFGVEEFSAIINPPEAAILAVGAIRSKFLPGPDGLPMACPVMHMTLSADHRIVDGATAAQFLSDLLEALEDPVLLLS